MHKSIHILFDFIEGPYGGGNQFLKALKKVFIKDGVYENNFIDADIIIFNSHHMLRKVIKLKLDFPNKIFIHRVDGPIFFIRNGNLSIDKILFKVNQNIANGTIFQSHWSKNKCYDLGLKLNNKEITILNAPNSNIFYRKLIIPLDSNKKIKIIITSWSSNYKKGFYLYDFLDKNLNFDKYEVEFVGNSPIKFNNIKLIAAIDSKKLSIKLRESDIYITASLDDPCSNSLIEAIHCGLLPIVINSGGHPEIVKNFGLIFEGENDIIKVINYGVKNYSRLIAKLNIGSINYRAKEYYNFSKECLYEKSQSSLHFGYYKYILLNIYIIYYKIILKIDNIGSLYIKLLKK